MLASRSVTVRQTWCTPVMTGPFGVFIFPDLNKTFLLSSEMGPEQIFHWATVCYGALSLTSLDLVTRTLL
jgi:hypothetical protein